MATTIHRLSSLSRLNSSCSLWRTTTTSHHHHQLGNLNFVPRRQVQEFPPARLDNSVPRDYVLILAEAPNQNANTNELLRIPKAGEPEIDFTKITPELAYKGFSQAVCAFENYLTDVENSGLQPPGSVSELFKELERHLYPLDTAYNMMMLLLSISGTRYQHKEFKDLIKRYYDLKEDRLSGVIGETIQSCINKAPSRLTEADKEMIRIYQINQSKRERFQGLDKSTLYQFRLNLSRNKERFLANLSQANQMFAHTVDDPDILAAVSRSDLVDESQDNNTHHRERTPLQVSVGTYQRFMELCPDRFVRQMLWLTYNKRCSPKSFPRQNNLSLTGEIRVLRRKIADLLGYRSHLDLRLDNSMAKSRQNIISSLKHMQEINESKLKALLLELNDFAADSSFEDPQRLGIQEYDVAYWTRKYVYDILIGINEPIVRSYFPLQSVMRGLQNYFETYFGVTLKEKPDFGKQFPLPNVKYFEVSRNGQLVGNIIHDPYHGPNKRINEIFYARVRARWSASNHLPLRFISTPFKQPQAPCQQTHLGLDDIVDLFFSYGLVIQRLLYNYPYYELNLYGALEVDAKNLVPYLCVAHLLTDQRVLQHCSDRGSGKTIDSELASRILKALTYFKPLKQTWHDLYKAHLDLECHTVMTATKSLAEELYKTYSPFQRHADNYDFCAMNGIFVDPNDGIQYASLWSKQLANHCFEQVLGDADGGGRYRIDDDKARQFYPKLLDSLFDPNNLDTEDKLAALVGKRFESANTGLGVL